MAKVTTHVLDTTTGRPATGVGVRLDRLEGTKSSSLAETTTDADGRVRDWLPDGVPAGRYRLVFETGAWFRSAGLETLYPEIAINFQVVDGVAHYHVPLLLAPFGYSTYRGS